jgi:hypothetical protein
VVGEGLEGSGKRSRKAQEADEDMREWLGDAEADEEDS